MDQRQPWIQARLEFVQSQLAATSPYARSAQILGFPLPVATGNAASTVREHLLDIGRRVDSPSHAGTNKFTRQGDHAFVGTGHWLCPPLQSRWKTRL